MVDSQPGKVAAFEPSPTINLTDFSAASRDKFMFNENQLVLAKIQSPKPISIEIGTDPSRDFSNYVNLQGALALIDESFYSLESSGVPTTSSDSIWVGFDQQVTTSTIKFWSKKEFDIAVDTNIEIYTSFNDITYTLVASTTLAEARDETLEHYPGESPPSGLFVYTVTLPAETTARYWQIIFATETFEGTDITEVQVLPTTGPILEHWNSNGSKAVTNAIEGSGYYDITYDKADDVYYAIRFDETLPSALTLDPDDDFNGNTGSLFDSTKWAEDATHSYFLRSAASGTLTMVSNAGQGRLTGNYGVDGDVQVDLSLVAVEGLGIASHFSLSLKDYTDDNQYMYTSVIGPYIPGGAAEGEFAGANLTYSSTVGAAAVLQHFRVNPSFINYDIGAGIVDYDISYNSSTNDYSVTSSGTSHPNASPGVPYSIDSAEFTISNLYAPSDGQGFQVSVACSKTSIVGTASSGINLQLERIGTNGYVRYEDTDAPGVLTLQVGNIPSDRIKVEIFGDPNAQSVDLHADDFIVSGGTLFFNSPVFSVVTINKDGDLEQVSSVSDADGYAIKIFDVIQDLSADYNDYLYPRVGIATNGALHGSGGEVYIKINDTLYKYLKSALPLVSETGSGASVSTTGEIPETTIANFSYSGYSQGELSYIEYVNDLSGTFVKSISATTLLVSPLKAWLDVTSISHPFAWNVSDGSTLYFVDSGDELKLYDLNEGKAGFVNVTSDKQVLAAGTAETATVTAQVLNVYGEPKSTKTMTFSVSAGDGAVSPSTGCSDGSGLDTTTYTVGAAVGTAVLTVTVSDISC